MPTLKNKNGIDYFEDVDFKQIVAYGNNPNPICGECRKNLLFMDNLILIPILNEVYCYNCGIKKINTMTHYAEDDECQKRRTTFWKSYLIDGKLKEY